jgi:hypothetical protein
MEFAIFVSFRVWYLLLHNNPMKGGFPLKKRPILFFLMSGLLTISTTWWDSGWGVPIAESEVTFQSEGIRVVLGGIMPDLCPKISFPPDPVKIPLLGPKTVRHTQGKCTLTYHVESPRGITVCVERQFQEGLERNGAYRKETFSLIPSQPLAEDIEIEFPFQIQTESSNLTSENEGNEVRVVTWPLKNGWAKETPLGTVTTQGEYRLGNALSSNEIPQLALPLVLVGTVGCKVGLFTDPTFSTLFSMQPDEGIVSGSLVFRYASSQVPLQTTETRTFAVWIPRKSEVLSGLPDCLDVWFNLMLPDVSPGPEWLHEIAMVGYDFLSDDGRGWEKDIAVLARDLTLDERRRAALCLHGWYDALGVYCYDSANKRIKGEWTAFERTRKVHFTQMELRRRLRLARSLGFRVLLYFGDGLAADSGVPEYRDDWATRDAKGERTSGWQGPDTFGLTYLRNPAHPEVREWYKGYLSALLDAFGEAVDGFVWDETFHARTGQIAYVPEPAYCDRAMFTLVQELTQKIERYNPEKVFLTSDCIGVFGWEDVPGYGMVADGTYQDSHCSPEAWSYGLFPNWRNVLWSCNWSSLSAFDKTQWGVETFGVPVAISNGWGDDRGPSEWTPAERDKILQLFRKHLANDGPVRYLKEDPATLLSKKP